MIRILFLCTLLLASTVAAAQDTVVRFYGYAYHLDSNRYAYTEILEQRISGGQWVGGSTTYFLPDGREFGRKTLDFSRDPFVPVYRLEMKSGHVEEISDNGDPIRMSRAGKAAAAKRAGLVTADAGLPRLLRAHFDTLLARKKLAFRVVAPARLEAYDFGAVRTDDVTFEGKPAVRIHVELDSMLRMFAGPLFFTFDPQSKKLLEFRGTTNVQDPATGEPFVVRISYFTVPPGDAPALPPLPK